MSLRFRIIPKLDIKGPNLVKGIHLEGLRVLGKPEEFAKYFYENGADELIYQDVVASLYGRNSLNEIISKTAKDIFIPLTVGGGIKTVDDISSILRAGADKVSINTEAINNPDFISEASRKFGVSTIVIGIEAIEQENGEFMAFTDNGRNETNKNAIAWAMQAEKLGAGELLITSVDNEGTGSGINEKLLNEISNNVSIPVVFHGGIGKKEQVLKILESNSFISGLAICSLFHYDFINIQRRLDGYDEEGNIDFLKSKRMYGKIDPLGIKDLKDYLILHSNRIRD